MSPKYTGFSGDHKGVVVGCSLQACFGLAVLMHTPCALTGIQDKQSPSVRGGLWFVDVTSASGLHLQQSYGDRRLHNIVEGTGTGVCVFDYNNDGYLDIYFPNGKWTEGVSSPDDRDLMGKLKNHLFRSKGI